jgi:hypothetical protein
MDERRFWIWFASLHFIRQTLFFLLYQLAGFVGALILAVNALLAIPVSVLSCLSDMAIESSPTPRPCGRGGSIAKLLLGAASQPLKSTLNLMLWMRYNAREDRWFMDELRMVRMIESAAEDGAGDRMRDRMIRQSDRVHRAEARTKKASAELVKINQPLPQTFKVRKVRQTPEDPAA